LEVACRAIHFLWVFVVPGAEAPPASSQKKHGGKRKKIIVAPTEIMFNDDTLPNEVGSKRRIETGHKHWQVKGSADWVFLARLVWIKHNGIKNKHKFPAKLLAYPTYTAPMDAFTSPQGQCSAPNSNRSSSDASIHFRVRLFDGRTIIQEAGVRVRNHQRAQLHHTIRPTGGACRWGGSQPGSQVTTTAEHRVNSAPPTTNNTTSTNSQSSTAPSQSSATLFSSP
jgi:hypothetical protein